jgi:hypothetical protein
VGITRAPWQDAVGQIFIGSQHWVESMRPVPTAEAVGFDLAALRTA